MAAAAAVAIFERPGSANETTDMSEGIYVYIGMHFKAGIQIKIESHVTSASTKPDW